jgi:hypothetical protein
MTSKHSSTPPANQHFTPGERWLDTAGQPIQAHGGALLHHAGVWYWYGEDKTAHINSEVTWVTGVSCYQSRDLLNWENAGLCLKAEPDPASPLHRSKIVERPKVLFNSATGKFVMWLHLDELDYRFSCAGVAVSDRPEGPFQLVRCQRSFRHDYGWPENDPRQQMEKGNGFMDFNLFLDDDGQAYVFHVSENLMTLYVSKLSPDFTDFLRPEQLGVTWGRILPDRMREAPAPFKHDGCYYLFTSGCSGWNPNHTLLASAPHPLGPWEIVGDPFNGAAAATSFRTQPTAVFAAPHAPAGSFVFMANRWQPAELRDSRHVWLPFIIRGKSTTLDVRREWRLNIFTPKPPPTAPVLRAAKYFTDSGIEPAGIRLEWAAVPGADGYRAYANNSPVGFTDSTSLVLPLGLPGVKHTYTVRAEALAGGQSPDSNGCSLSHGQPRACYLSDFSPVKSFTGFGELVFDRSWDSSALRVDGHRFTKGFLAHLESEIVYDLGGLYARLTAVAGMNDTHPGGRGIFAIELDGRRVWETPLPESQKKSKPVELDVTGANTLRLLTLAPHGITNGHSVWADVVITPETK